MGKVIVGKSWKPNGEKCLGTKVANGNGILVSYNENGTEAGRGTFKDSE
jgi:antitoxin component YwqK of YwqJK toxin-antitoxin module